jgi:hypothetical protein
MADMERNGGGEDLYRDQDLVAKLGLDLRANNHHPPFFVQRALERFYCYISSIFLFEPSERDGVTLRIPHRKYLDLKRYTATAIS